MKRVINIVCIILVGQLMSYPTSSVGSLINLAAIQGIGAIQASATTTAVLDIEPQVAVQPRTPTIRVIHAGTGEIEVTAEFMIGANVPVVDMYVEATDFFFMSGSDAAPSVAPVPLLESGGVYVQADGATNISGGANPLPFVGRGDPVEGLESQKTDHVTYQSNEPYAFNHVVAVTVTWIQEDPNKPAGQYAAKIKLTCLAVPGF